MDGLWVKNMSESSKKCVMKLRVSTACGEKAESHTSYVLNLIQIYEFFRERTFDTLAYISARHNIMIHDVSLEFLFLFWFWTRPRRISVESNYIFRIEDGFGRGWASMVVEDNTFFCWFLKLKSKDFRKMTLKELRACLYGLFIWIKVD